MKSHFMGALLVAAAAATLAAGCGEQKIEQASASSNVEPAAMSAPVAQPATPVEGGSTSQAESTSNAAEGPGPEVAASIGDTLGTLGGVVEITAEASDDVVEVVLKDDLGRKQPLSYDADHKVWKTSYRVPMRLSSDRLGLSVTARNDAHQWRRVWLFLEVQGAQNATSSGGMIESGEDCDGC